MMEDALKSLLFHHQVEKFLYSEARLLDERKFRDWVQLFTEDASYSMPLRRNVKFGEWEREFTREEDESMWFADNKETLEERVEQLMTGVHWAEEPVSRTRHCITNIVVGEVQKTEPLEVMVSSNILTYRNRMNTETDWFVGRRFDTLRETEGDWRIARRLIEIDQNVMMAKNLTLFL